MCSVSLCLESPIPWVSIKIKGSAFFSPCHVPNVPYSLEVSESALSEHLKYCYPSIEFAVALFPVPVTPIIQTT